MEKKIDTIKLPEINTKRLILQLPKPEYAQVMCDFVVNNKDHLSIWESLQENHYYTKGYWEKRINEINKL
jgi:hypothetical protein